MQTNARIEPPSSAVPGIIPEPVRVDGDAETPPAAAPRRPNPKGGLVAKLLSVLRGDKYMADAYPPPDAPPGAATQTKGR